MTAAVPEPAVYRVEMPFQRPPLNLNQRTYWAPKGRATKELREQVGWAVRGARVPRCNGVPPRLVTVALFYAPGDNRERDEDNLVATLKVVADAIVDAGVTIKDTPRFMRKLMPEIVPPPEPGPRCWLTIEVAL